MYGFYEFFAGGGMVRAGLGEGWDCLLANDISAKKAQSYAENWGASHLRVGDIFNLRTSDLPGVAELAWGSFPCQDLSLAGLGAGLGGERSGAFWGFWRLIQGLNAEGRKPRLVLLENVYGALTSHEGRDFDSIALALSDEGYCFGAMVIDAAHFLPQSRPRLFILGVDANLVLPDGVHAWTAHPAWHPDALIRAHNRLSHSRQAMWRWWNPPAPDSAPMTLDDVIEAQPQGVAWHTQDETAKILASMSEVNRRKVLAAQAAGKMKVGTVYRRTRQGVVRAEVRFDGVSGCLRTPTGGSSRQTIMVVDGANIRTRLLSPREAARLMGLPDDYRLPQRYNDAYHLAGDGVAVPVVAHLARTLFEPIIKANSSDLRAPGIQARLAA
ncbi:MAG: DNA cytosine methyltransferase [Pseudomonadota bacterium]